MFLCCCCWGRKRKHERISDALAALEREISETEHRLERSLERLWSVKLRVVVVGVAAIVSSTLWFIGNLEKHEYLRYSMPFFASIIMFVVQKQNPFVMRRISMFIFRCCFPLLFMNQACRGSFLG